MACGPRDHCSLHGLCYHSRMSEELLDCSTAADWVEEGGLDRGKVEGRHKQSAGGTETGHKVEERSLDGNSTQRAEQEHAGGRGVQEHGRALEPTAAEELDNYSPADGSSHTGLRVGQDMAAQCIHTAVASCGSRHGPRGSGHPYGCLIRRRDSGRRESDSTVRSWHRQK